MTREQFAEKINARLAIYRDKWGRADPLAEDSYNRHEALRYVVEALELLAIEASLGDLVPHDPGD